MKGLDNSTYLMAYIFFNALAFVMLLAAWKAPRIARLMFFALFAWASYANWSFAIRSPQVYLEYADLAFSNHYKQFILGWFSRHIALAVGFIASCQALIAISMLLRGLIFKIGSIGAIVFLISIAPLGVGSGFPCTVIMSAALIVILNSEPANYLWLHFIKN